MCSGAPFTVVEGFDDIDETDSDLEDEPVVGVSDWGVLNQLVNMNCVPLILIGDAKRQGLYWFRQSAPYV